METLFILLQQQESLGERVFIGAITALIITAFIAIKNRIKDTKQKNKKDWDEVSKDESFGKSNHTSDWNDDK